MQLYAYVSIYILDQSVINKLRSYMTSLEIRMESPFVKTLTSYLKNNEIFLISYNDDSPMHQIKCSNI